MKILIAFFFLIPLLMACSEEIDTYSVTEENIVESVYSSIVIEPSDLYKVNASTTGFVDELKIKIGDDVDLGQLLISINDVQSANNANNARLAYEMAQTNYRGEANVLEDLKLQLKDALLKSSNDSVNFERISTLFSKGLATKLELEQAEMVYQLSKSQRSMIQSKIKRSEIELKNAVKQSKNNFSSSQSHFEDGLIRSKLQGKVYDIFKEPGELVSPMEPLAIIGSRDKFVIKMRVDEVDITRIKLGQEIIVSLEAYNTQTFKAKVTRISPKMDMQTQTFEVEGEFEDLPESLFMGLTGEGNIVINQREKVLVIPLEYLEDGSYVYTAAGKTEVKIGARSLSHVEILSGVKVGDELTKPE